MVIFSFLFILYMLSAAGAVTVYSQLPMAITPTTSAPGSTYTGAAAYDPTVLSAPPIPNPPPPTQFGIQLYSNASSVPRLSIPLNGAFLGFSIEMSVVDQVRK